MAIKIILFFVSIGTLLTFGILSVIGFVNYTNEVDSNRYIGGRDEDESKAEKPTKAIIFLIIAILALIFTIMVPGNIHQVSTGEVAVVKRLGKIEGQRDPGVHWDFYITKDYQMYDTKIQSLDFDDMQTYSKDNQTIGVALNLQYQIQADKVTAIAETIGTQEALEARIKPIVLDSVKSVFAQNSAEDIIKSRSEVTATINTQVAAAVQSCYVNVYNVLLTNLDFTDDFEAAVAAKVAQEQKKQQALIEQEQELAKAENDKKIAVEKAKAEAEAAELAAEAQANVAEIKAKADAEVAKIEADTAEYQGKKQAAIALQKLASVNGWTVVQVKDSDNNVIQNKLMKPDNTIVTEAELAVGVTKLVEVYKIEKWDGKLPVYSMDPSGTIVVTP